jgi:hypothetical protein
MELIGEDGNPWPYSRQSYCAPLPALKTLDAVLTVASNTTFALYDRRLGLVNSTYSQGGMLTHLDVDDPIPPPQIPPDSWLETYFGPGPYPPGFDHADPDGDGADNYSEFIAGTNPNDASSVLRITSFTPDSTGETNLVTFATTVTGRGYNLQYRADLMQGIWLTLYTNVPGYPDFMSLPAPITTGGTSEFYRVTIQWP